jgi:hypothetical protein
MPGNLLKTPAGLEREVSKDSITRVIVLHKKSAALTELVLRTAADVTAIFIIHNIANHFKLRFDGRW